MFVLVGGAVCVNPTQRVLPHSLIWIQYRSLYPARSACVGLLSSSSLEQLIILVNIDHCYSHLQE